MRFASQQSNHHFTSSKWPSRTCREAALAVGMVGCAPDEVKSFPDAWYFQTRRALDMIQRRKLFTLAALHSGPLKTTPSTDREHERTALARFKLSPLDPIRHADLGPYPPDLGGTTKLPVRV
ncbi:hypothetical protein FPRO05_10720 [Fusarium proliferatum]|uniref:Uncharacterized protein n=1 Tax=Gibberella intermedia TaxID=948311 RepID=A0A365NC84_GIBIN|nr:hypothetical protein FPRO05_10720 [Fusarium proliferatum]